MIDGCTTQLPTLPTNMIGLIIAKRFRLSRKIGEGSFGAVFVAQDLEGRASDEVAVKVEVATAPAQHSQLHYESRVLRHLWVGSTQSAPPPGMPYHYFFGEQGGHNFMAITLLGLLW